MDDAREWTATAPRRAGDAPASVQPGDPWGAPLLGSEAPDPRRHGTPPGALLDTPAGFWRRALALIVDLGLVVAVVRAGLWLASGFAALAPGLHLVAQAFGLTWVYFTPTAYFVLGHGTAGQTFGKRLVGVRVIDEGGGPIGYVRALGRCVATVLAALPLGLGLALAGLRIDRRGLHDFLAGTRVVRVR
jgi:uncharacterized RDD family membrane protein YckC